MESAYDNVNRLAVLDEPLRRRLFDYVRHSSEPVTREEAAETVGIGRSLAAYHLDKLVEHGLLTTTYRRPEGRTGPGSGRPAKLYAAAEGELSVSVPARDYEFVAELLAEAAETSPADVQTGLHTVATRTGSRHAEELGDAPDASLVEVLTIRVYEPYEDHRDLVCGMNQAYMEGLLEGLDRDDVTASLEPEPGRCCVAIRARDKP